MTTPLAVTQTRRTAAPTSQRNWGRAISSLLGTALLLASVAGGLWLLAIGPAAAPLAPVTEQLDPDHRVFNPVNPSSPARGVGKARSSSGVNPNSSEGSLPITHLVITSIALDAEVVSAPLVTSGGATSWQVPAFFAGHAEGTAHAGEAGNAVLMGHIESLHSGDVFKELNRVQAGDLVQIFSADQRFDYTVTDVASVPRSDVSILEPTSDPTVTLFTCTGIWNPAIWDFTERLVVHGRLLPMST